MKKEAGEASSMVRQKLEQTADMAQAAAGMAEMVEDSDSDSWVIDRVSTAHDDIMEVASYLQSKAGPAGPIEVDVEPSGMMQTEFDGQDGSRMVGDMGASENTANSFSKQIHDIFGDTYRRTHLPWEKKTSQSDVAIHTAGKNNPTNPSLWARAKAAAKNKFDVYPSAYANGWAVKWYKKHGGGWKKSGD